MLVKALLALTCALTSLAQSNFTNPIIYSDYPDNDVSVGPDGAFYLSASNFHYSPGAPILRSYDLVNWEPVGHSIPRLIFSPDYDLPATGEYRYRYGTWASSLRYRKANKTWYWIGCVNFWQTYVFTASNVEGPWESKGHFGDGVCFYDNGILVDDDDQMYVVSGNPQVKVARLAGDGLSVVETRDVFNAGTVGVDSIEGNRMYKINGTYYILNDKPGGTTYIWKSKSVWGPYEVKELVKDVQSPVEAGSSPHQGSLIQTKDGKWYFMSFTWAYPAGRMPVLAPITWGSDGFPVFVPGADGSWAKSYPLPLPARPVKPLNGTYRFTSSPLPPTFEWNHNPDVASYSISNGLTLRTASVTPNLYAARNTLTHRTFGPFPVGTVELDFSSLADGDRTGFAAFRDRSAYIGIHREGSTYSIVAAHNQTIDEFSGATLSLGYEVARVGVKSGAKKIWLRVKMDARAAGTKEARFEYSYDGKKFVGLGGAYALWTNWPFFLGYRFAVFNFATKALGGAVKVVSFTSA